MDSIADSLVYSSGGCTCRLKRHDDRTAGTNLEFTVTMPDGYSISAYSDVAQWSSGGAAWMLGEIEGNGGRIPSNIDPATYKPC